MNRLSERQTFLDIYKNIEHLSKFPPGKGARWAILRFAKDNKHNIDSLKLDQIKELFSPHEERIGRFIEKMIDDDSIPLDALDKLLSSIVLGVECEVEEMIGNNKKANIGKTFLPWPGGKRKLAAAISEYVPKEFENYYEPFFGAGSLFFTCGYKAKNKAYLNDLNKILMSTFKCVKEDVNLFIENLAALKEKYKPYTQGMVPKAGVAHPKSSDHIANGELKKEGFEKAKICVNEFLAKNVLESDYAACASFLYLMKTCFGGVFQISPKGKCTSSFGNFSGGREIYKNIVLQECAKKLINSNAVLSSDDFSIFEPQRNDFVFLDPPYHHEEYKIQYTAKRFDEKDQVRVRDYCLKLRERGVPFVLTNSNTPFTRELYKDFQIEFTGEKRAILKDGRKRFLAPGILVHSEGY